MLLASEAREQAEKINTSNELQIIEDEIKKKISSGEMSLTFYGCVSENTKKELERCGYQIFTGTQYYDEYITIIW